MRAFALLVLFAGSVCAQTPQIASGDDFTAIIDSSNDLYTYGANGSGQLGIGDTTDVGGAMQRVEPQGVWQSVSVSKSAVSGATASGLGHVLAIRTDGTLWAWGANDRGQLGIGSYVDQSSPVQVIGMGSVVEVAAGSHFSMARTSTGVVYVWGDNTSGQLARGINPQEANGFGTPEDGSGNPINCTPIPGLLDGNDYISIAAGLTSAVAVRASAPGVQGSLYAWGYSTSRQLGYNISTASTNEKFRPTIVPHRIGSDSDWTEVFSGNTLCFALKGGALHTWGFALNRGTTSSNYDTPVRVGTASDWETVSIGHDHTLALKNGGELWGWGNNDEGELGIEIDFNAPGWNQNFSTPTRLESGTNFTAIGAGLNFSTIITDDLPPVVKTAGINTVGQLGIGSTDNGNHVSFDEDSIDFSIFDTVDLSLDSLSLNEDPSYPGVDPATNLIAGGTLYISVEMANIGWADLTTDFDLGAKLSVDAVYDAADLDLDVIDGSLVSTNIDAGDSVTVGFRLELPATLDSGQYYLILRGDSGVALNEDPANRENNDISSDLLTFIPDVTADVEILSSDFASGTTLNAVLQVENIGTWSTTESFEITAVLSPVISYESPAAIPLTVTAGASLSDQINPSESLNAFVSVLLPASIPDGCYYLIYRLDDAEVLGEVVVSNNDALGVDQICFEPDLADLVVTNLQALSDPLNPSDDPANNLIAGGQLVLSMDLGNIGITDITADFDLAAVLSQSTFFDDPGAIPLTFVDGESVLEDIVVDGVVSVGARLQLPATLDHGVYNLIIRGDSGEVLTEVTRDNNDGRLEALSFIPDVALSLEILTDEFVPGASVDGIATIENVGSWTAAGGYELTAVMVTTAFYDGLTPVALTITSSSFIADDLNPGESIQIPVQFTLPGTIAEDCYYFALRADDARLLDEVVIVNNDAVTEAVCFGSTEADLVVSGVTALESVTAPSLDPLTNLIAGGELALSIHLENIGGTDITDNFEFAAYLSPSAFISDPDAVTLSVLDGALVELGIESEDSATVGVRVLLPASITHGTYNLIIVGDSGEVLTEITRVNNTSSLGGLVFVPDVALSVEILTDEFVEGGIVDAIATIENVGSWTAAAGYKLTAVMVTTPFYDGLNPEVLTLTDVLTLNIPEVADDLNPGESIQIPVRFTLPGTIAEDCYYFALRADDARLLDEQVIVNNDAVTEAVCFGSTDADLVVSGVTALELPSMPGVDPLTNLVAGGEFVVSIDLANIGGTAITDAFEFTAYLSPSAFITDPGAVELTFLDGAVAAVDIAAGGSATVGARLQLPASIPHGTYNLIIVGDSGEVLTEITRVNNDSSLDGLSFVPDVALSIEVLDPAFSLGGSIDIRLTIENVGTWTAVEDFDLSVVLGTTPFYDGLDAQLLTVTTGDATVTADLNPGDSIQVDLSVGIPVSISDDKFYLIARADDARVLDEVVLVNNDAVAGEQFSVGVDIAVPTIILSDPTPALGVDLDATVFIENLGSRGLTDGFDLRAVLSLTPDFDDPDAIPLLFTGSLNEFEVTTDIAAQGSISVPVTFEFPAALDQGTYYLVLCADPDDAVVELDETNNCVVAEEIIELLPDITFEAATGVVLATPGTYVVGQPMEITLDLNNTGEGTIPAGTEFDIRVFLTPTTNINDPSAVELFTAYTHTVGVGGFTPGVPLPIVLNVGLPLGLLDGDYYIGAVVDVNEGIAEQTEILSAIPAESREDGEANNVYLTATQVVTFSTDADLVVSGVTALESAEAPGVDPLTNLVADGELVVSIDLANIGGTAITDAFEFTAYLSPSAFITDLGAIPLTFLDGAVTGVDIAAGGSTTVGARLQLPATLDHGVYNLIIRGDSGEVLTEVTRDNNDGSLEALSFIPDVALSLEILTDEFVPGASVDGIATIENVGSWTAAAGYKLTAVMVTTPFYDGLNPEVLTLTDVLTLNIPEVADDLNPGESIQIPVRFTLPGTIAEDCYYFALRADDARLLDEQVIVNNDAVTEAVCFGSTDADLVVSGVTALELPSMPGVDPLTNLVAGGEFVVSIDLANIGGTAITDAFEFTAYLSPSAFITDPGAVELTFLDGAVAAVDIAAGGSATVGARLQLPASIPHGTYNLIIVGDSGEVLTEITRVNNDSSLDGLSFVPDVALSIEVLDPAFSLGGSIDIRLTIENVGTWTAVEDFDLSVVLGTTPFYDGLDAQLLTVTTGDATVTADLNPGDSIQVDLSVGIPVSISDDKFYLIARADDARVLDEDVLVNNDAVTGEQFSVGVDIAVPTIILSDPTPALGVDLDATVFIENLGSRGLTDGFDLRAVLSLTPDFDDPDAIPLLFTGSLNEFEVTTDIAAQGSISVPVTFEFPAALDQGTYYLVLCADPDDAVVELDETNNCVVAEEIIELLPDITFEAATGVVLATPGTYVVGQPMEITLDLNNTGEGTIPAGTEFDIRVFLTPTTNINDPSAVELFTAYTHTVGVGGFTPGVPLPIVLNVGLPLGLLDGDYYIGAVVDVNEGIAEQTEILSAIPAESREDGEANNVYLTATQAVTFAGIDLAEAVDQSTQTITTDGDGTWFGQNQVFITGGDAAQSPAISGGESASFSTSFTEPVVITFDWSSNTSSADNKLVFSIIGGGNGVTNQISGDSAGWETVSRLIPAGAEVRWEYLEGVDAADDVVYVDNLSVTLVTDPDLVINGIDLTDDSELIESGTYVLLRDPLELTVNTRNQGTLTGAEDAVLSVYLSNDRFLDRFDGDSGTVDDILIRQETIEGPFPGSSPSFTGLVIDLPADIEPGDYYVITYIDDYLDAAGGTIPGATIPDGQITEFASGVFNGEENNIFVTGDPVVAIVGLADLVVSDVNASPDYYRIVEGGLVNSFGLDFTLSNLGVVPYVGTVVSKIVFSKNQIIEASDYSLLNYNYSGGFGAIGSAPANEEFITPDNIDFNPNLIDQGYIGERLFLGVIADSSNTVPELNETNNTGYLLSNDFILSELELVEGLDLDATTITAQSVMIFNDEVAPYDSSQVPWVGQTTETFDGVDAVTSVIVGDNEISEFSINVEPTIGVRVSFWWKVSSQNELVEGVSQRDVLRFSVDGAQVVPDIFGTDVDEWRRIEVLLDAGVRTLTWSYIKDDQGSDGEDRGWVDRLTITDLPNLEVTGIITDDSAVFTPGDSIATWSVTIQNTGDDIAPGTTFDVAVRLLTDNNWDALDSVNLLTITDSAGIAAGATRTYDQTSDGDLLLPLMAYLQEFYYIGAYVDWSLGDEVNGVIVESEEDDNVEFTANAVIQLGLPDLISGASSVVGITDTYQYDDASGDILLFVGLTNGGEGTLVAGSTFDLEVYASTTNDPLLINGTSSYLLATVPVTVASDVAAGADLAFTMVSSTLPYGVPLGDYYLGLVIDSDDTVKEQGALPTVLVPDQTRDDGEGNNIFFTPSASFEVVGITLQEALEDVVGPLNTITTDGDAAWFGRSGDGDTATVDDNQIFTDDDGAQSPRLAEGESASFSLVIDTTSVVTFEWGIEGESDLNELSLIFNGVEIRSISGDTAFATIDPAVLVPDNSILTWVYTKNAATTGDVAYVDNIELAPNTLPDLVLTNIDYTPGTYVLDVAAIVGAPEQKLGTMTLDITVEAENQGEDLPLGTGVFTSADLEVRLSTDRTYGNGDDIVLGSFSQVEGGFGSGELLRFIGGLPLRDDIPEGDYYLIAKIDSNERVAEFSDLNNIFITENRDVTIEARPRLRLFDTAIAGITSTNSQFYTDVMGYDEEKLYTPGASMQVALSIHNYGLDDLIDDESGELQDFINELYIVAVDREDLEGYIANVESDLSTIDFEQIVGGSLLLDDFSVLADLQGRRAGFPDGDVVNINLEVILPNATRLSSLIGDKSISDFVYFLRVVIDSPNDILESSLVNIWNNVNVTAIPTSFDPGAPFFDPAVFAPYDDEDDGLFSITGVVASDLSSWNDLYGVTADPVADPANFLAYAFNRNPSSNDTVDNRFPGSYGFDEVAGDDYLSITFDFQYLVNDLIYQIEVSDDLLTWDLAATIDTTASPDGGFTEGAGEFSLTADGGLIDSDSNIISITDFGTYARITVIDDVSSSGPGARFMRVTVESVEATPVPAGP